MKKLFTILALLAFLVVPAASMAMVQTSDADLAAITGQSGVSIDVTGVDIALQINTITWGDYDGDQTYGTGFANAGYINVALYPLAMHIGIGEVKLTVDVGTMATSLTTTKTAVILGVTIPKPITIDAFIADINLDPINGAAADYLGNQGTPYTHVASSYAGTFDPGSIVSTTSNTINGYGYIGYGPTYGALATNTLGVFGISGISVTLPNTMVITIAPH